MVWHNLFALFNYDDDDDGDQDDDSHNRKKMKIDMYSCQSSYIGLLPMIRWWQDEKPTGRIKWTHSITFKDDDDEEEEGKEDYVKLNNIWEGFD